MGQEVPCSVRTANQQVTGKALLEPDEIVFRGGLRMKIPLASLQSISSRDGELQLKWEGGEAVFLLGKYADQWAQRILHPKSTAEKLGVKAGLTISAMGMNDAVFLRDLRKTTGRFSGADPLKDSDLIFFAADDLAALSRMKQAAKYLGAAGALWIVYPKGRKDIKEQHVLDAGKQAGMVDVKVVSFSSTHTALKFVRPKTKRPSHPETRRA